MRWTFICCHCWVCWLVEEPHWCWGVIRYIPAGYRWTEGHVREYLASTGVKI